MTFQIQRHIKAIVSEEKKEKKRTSMWQGSHIFNRVNYSSEPNRRAKLRMVCSGCILFLFFAVFCQPAISQIGGKVASEGPFTLDNVEDLNTTASGVNRVWIPDPVSGSTTPFTASTLNGSGMTLMGDQTPIGALRYAMVSKFGYIDYSFGVPVPSVPGGSTLPFPGNITSFTHLSFKISLSTSSLVNQVQEVILETYPGPPYPSIRWDYTASSGPAFQQISVDLRQPTYILNQNGLPIEELLSKTRYLAFYFFAGPVTGSSPQTIYIDDMQLIGISSTPDWSIYQ